MASPAEIEALREKAVELAQAAPLEEAISHLEEMGQELGVQTAQDDPPTYLAMYLFDSMEMAQHLENLSGQDVPMPNLRHLGSLTELRNALLL